jgi:PhnB protein
MTALVPYLNFDGNCREAMTFYKTCLGADLHLITLGEMDGKTPDAIKDRIMHASLTKGSVSLMASDIMPDMPFQKGTNFSVSVHPESVEEIERVWKAFRDGATIQQKLDDAPWGARFGMLVDKFGVRWMFNYEYPK